MSGNRLKICLSLIAVAIGAAAWRHFSHDRISRSRAEEIAALHLIGKPHFSSSVPVEVHDDGETYKVMFTFDTPKGVTDEDGRTYKSYAVVQKKDGEVLELGILPPEP